MSPRRRLTMLVALGMSSALIWGLLGTFDSASGGQKPALIARAHAGERAPTFDKPIFLLVLGGDARKGNPRNVLMDSIHIVALDPVTKRASIVGIPRDSYVDIPGHGQDKINAAGFDGGPDLMVQTVENLSGCRFDYYMLTSFDGFRAAVKHFGGITFTVPQGGLHDANARANLSGGVQTLDGPQALAWSRARYTRPRGDFDRSESQGQLLIAALAEARGDQRANPGSVLRNLSALRHNVEMNIPLDEALSLGLFALRFKPRAARNAVLDGYATIQGGASIVRITDAGKSTLVDICSDGVVGS